MAKPPRRLLYQAWCSFIDSFKPRTSKAELMGEDMLGNKYFEAKPTSISHRTKPSRYYLPASGEEDFMQELPAEWEAWLRGRRKVPPTPEELAKNYAIMLQKKENAKKLEAEREGAKLLDTPMKPKGMESYPQYGDHFEDMPGRNLDPNRKPK
ncbi:NADH dehydrogenase [ubiquinone] 1 alpha subcomplex assembly factor 2 [Thrips palmi]|uniref:NADH dehydrogenase [ubiquinone] 1 alpha subcomplex assembly factor 2 n=1 Tax=Thrips palmi TaxID=161013 RepID=A0A6P8YM91_THRPL|nr:NADH dehydrogenase [ubiquinone] 1 alpha subcomplex assembly factor 2 [Thrips palmi]XP_034238250.1 NADH dehydrogenase [ubiquinone] 1 alpha subcomplex assembly factor 2 [Thrips palmi]